MRRIIVTILATVMAGCASDAVVTPAADLSVAPQERARWERLGDRAEAGSTEAMLVLGRSGHWLSQADRLRFLEMAETAGSAEAALLLGEAYDSGWFHDGLPAPAARGKAVRHYEEAVRLGSVAARYWLGQALAEGRGTVADLGRAERLLTEAADTFPQASIDLAAIALTVHNRPDLARTHLETAAAAGLGTAKRNLAKLVLDRTFASPDPENEAVALLMAGAEDDLCWDCLYLAGSVRARQGDHAAATEIWMRAADKGDPSAMIAIAEAIERDLVATESPEVEAAGWRLLSRSAQGEEDLEAAALRARGIPEAVIREARKWASRRG